MEAAWCAKLCAQRDTQLIALLSCVVVCYITRGWLFPLVLFLGGLHTYIGRPPPEQKAADNDDAASSVQYLGLNRPMGGALIFVWLAALIALPIYKDNVKYEDAKQLHWFESFYRTGSIIWGGGQVVLPLLLGGGATEIPPSPARHDPLPGAAAPSSS